MASPVILIVEDNLALRTIYRNKLKHDGFVVIEATLAKDALTLLQDHEVNLLLLDIMLPDKNGLSFLEEIRGYPKFAHLPTILLTSLPDEVGFEKSRALGISGYLIKDQVTPAIVSQRVKLALEESQKSNPPSPSFK